MSRTQIEVGPAGYSKVAIELEGGIRVEVEGGALVEAVRKAVDSWISVTGWSRIDGERTVVPA